jgi:predicted transcriptional regulator YdeE
MSHISHNTLTEPIAVAGFQVRTSNAAELSGTGKIGALWQRFFTENLLSQIPHQASDSLYVVYSNYESDEHGEYDYLLGTPVSSVSNLPAGVTFAAIATGRYTVVATERGPVAEMVMGTWKEIWQMPVEELGGKRAFLTDYEVYGERATDPNSAIVEIHLGLEPGLD